MAQDNAFDLVIIGGGPAGYVGAIRAGQLGMKVACVEREALGGICLNWGCIPTKALLGAAEFYHRLKHDAGTLGIHADNIRHDWSTVIGRPRKVVSNLTRGIAGLFKKNKVTHVQGHARIVARGKIEVSDVESGKVTQTLTAKNIVIATGSQPRSLPGVDLDGQKIISYRQAMVLPEQPQSLTIIGAGAIGMEFAYFFNAFGTKVTVIEMQDRVLPIEDEEVSALVARSFSRAGITILTGHKTLAVEKNDQGVAVTVAPNSDANAKQTLQSDRVLVAVGVQGRTDNLLAPDLGVELIKNHIKVDRSTYKTSVPGIYAVGDVAGPPWLAHVASEEAIVCVEQIAGLHAHSLNYDNIPGCTYCQPQVASVGSTEKTLKDNGVAYKVGKFPFSALGKAQATGHTEGFVKILSDPQTGEILGAHMVGDNVTELIAELVFARQFEATADEVIATMHAHPTLSEAIHEAALGTQNRALHF